MALEIERKWLVNTDFELPIEEETPLRRIKQCYLINLAFFSLRLRKTNWTYEITVKGKSSDDGLVRSEWEREVHKFIGAPLMFLFGRKALSKTRYIVEFLEKKFEVDVFEGRHKGLTLIELELNSKDEEVTLPPWVGEEVTGDPRYYNACLIKQ